jgi:hypothetical protein
MPYKQPLGCRQAFGVKKQNRENSGKSIFSHLPVTWFVSPGLVNFLLQPLLIDFKSIYKQVDDRPFH